MKKENVPIGKLILQELKRQEYSIAWLSKKVYCRYGTLCKALKRNHLNTALLSDISKALKYDFFAHYSALLKEQSPDCIVEPFIEKGKDRVVIGKLIRRKLKEQERFVAWLARKLDFRYSTLCKILKRGEKLEKHNHIDTTDFTL